MTEGSASHLPNAMKAEAPQVSVDVAGLDTGSSASASPCSTTYGSCKSVWDIYAKREKLKHLEKKSLFASCLNWTQNGKDCEFCWETELHCAEHHAAHLQHRSDESNPRNTRSLLHIIEALKLYKRECKGQECSSCSNRNKMLSHSKPSHIMWEDPPFGQFSSINDLHTKKKLQWRHISARAIGKQTYLPRNAKLTEQNLSPFWSAIAWKALTHLHFLDNKSAPLTTAVARPERDFPFFI